MEILSMKEKLQEVEKQNESLEKKLNPAFANEPLLTLEISISELNPMDLIKLHHFAIKSVKSFVKLMIDEMEQAKLDLDAVMSSIELDSAHAKPSQKFLAFESYVCRNMFADCHDSHFSNIIEFNFLRVGRQVVNIASFMVRVDSQKHIDFSLTSPLGGGRPGRVKRKNQKAAAKKASGGGGGGGDGDEDEED